MSSFSVGAIALLAYILVTKQSFSWTGIPELPLQYWLGGVLGAVYVTIVILVFPKLGPGLTFSLIVASQMTAALFLEHFNLLVANQQSVSFGRVGGIALIVLGVICLKRF